MLGGLHRRIETSYVAIFTLIWTPAAVACKEPIAQCVSRARSALDWLARHWWNEARGSYEVLSVRTPCKFATQRYLFADFRNLRCAR